MFYCRPLESGYGLNVIGDRLCTLVGRTSLEPSYSEKRLPLQFHWSGLNFARDPFRRHRLGVSLLCDSASQEQRRRARFRS